MVSEVGYLHEHPDIETVIKRKGINPMNEDELIQTMNMAVTNQRPATWDSRYDHLAGSHLLSGMEFISLRGHQDAGARGFDSDNPILSDPRAALFAASFSRTATSKETTKYGANPPLPETETIKRRLRDDNDTNPSSAIDALRTAVSRKISSLVLLAEGVLLGPDQPLSGFGLDSMLAAELRTFVFRAWNVDVPFVVLLKKNMTVNGLVGLIAEELGGGGG
ncbi:acyl carrier protein [Aspergillus melleus]|uniref:acyl carrier protein n=1 Tax=Aspergillus melleus TaxID=138277 RepID=UPI001E8DA262|nr:uncharacterized protein LDX57_011042 [Aspergillus melleus]KAH8433408.1 hypothetical protein LDX57_011042 [Aspergillus melleus]